MDDKERIRILETTLARLLQWIAAAESRIAVTLGVDTALMGSMVAFAPTPSSWTIAAAAVGVVAMLCISISLLCVGFASFPRTDGPKQSFIFFQGIADRDEAQYLRDAKALTSEMYAEDLARQCHRNAQIALIKFSWVKRAQAWLFGSVLPWIISIYLLYLGK